MPDVLLSVDGAATPVEDCHWVRWAPCGCPVGVVRADIGPLVVDEQAEREFTDRGTIAEVRKARRDGYRVTLIHQSNLGGLLDEMRRTCSHKEPHHDR